MAEDVIETTAEEETTNDELSLDDALFQVTGEKFGDEVEKETEDSSEVEQPEPEKQEVDEEEAKPDNEEKKEPEEEKKEPTEVEKLQRQILRLSGHNSKLQHELNNKAKLVRKEIKAPVIDEHGVFTESFSELKKEFPEADFGRVEEIIKAQNEQLHLLRGQVEQATRAIGETRQETAKDRLMQEITTTHSDFKEVVTSQEFKDYLQSLPPETQEVVTSTNDAGTIGIVLDNFKVSTGYKSKAEREAESQEEARKTAESRKRRNSASLGVPSKQQPAPKTGVGDGFNEDAEYKRVFEDLGVA